MSIIRDSDRPIPYALTAKALGFCHCGADCDCTQYDNGATCCVCKAPRSPSGADIISIPSGAPDIECVTCGADCWSTKGRDVPQCDECHAVASGATCYVCGDGFSIAAGYVDGIGDHKDPICFTCHARTKVSS